MIRRSSIIAVTALVLSLALHYLGIGLTFSNGSPRPPSQPVSEVANQGDSFENIADLRVEPVEPEPAEVPEPPAETPPEPEPAEAPTSQALVASPNPQRVPSPDRGTTQSARPDTSGPVTPETGNTPEPETTAPSGGTQTGLSDARLTPPVGAEAASDTRQGEPQSDTEPDNPAPQAPVAQAATTPPVTPPVPPAAAAPSPPVIAALPREATTALPENAQPDPQSNPQADDADVSTESISASLRPQLRPAEAPSRPRGTQDGATENAALRTPTDLIESPLTAYRRDGTNVFAGRRGGSQSRGGGFGGSLGPGNADVTNYAGLVLMHLNRTPPVAVSARGWARVIFRINPDGTLESVDIIDGSGSSEIDRAAQAQVRLGEPFPLPPGGQSRMLNFVYSIR